MVTENSISSPIVRGRPDAKAADTGTAEAPDVDTTESQFKAQKDNIAHLSEISQNARTTFFALLLASAYCFLTIGTTTDGNLISNSDQSQLPIIQASVPVVWFYYFAPLLITVIYLYFHLYLLRFWRGVAALPVIHPDGRSLDDYVYPWLISNSILRSRISDLKLDKLGLVWLESAICVFLAWWLVPILLLFFWGRFLTRHEWVGTSLHIVLISVSVAAAFGFYGLARADVKRVGGAATDVEESPSRRPMANVAAAGVATAAILSVVSYSSIEGAPREHCEISSIPGCESALLGMRLLELVGYRPIAELDESEVSVRPDDWDELAPTASTLGVVGAGMRNRDLRHAHAREAFLVKADLRGSDLRWSRLDGAKLMHADLRGTDLTAAKLSEANLIQADLTNAIARRTDMLQADLSGAELTRAELTGATIEGAKLLDAAGEETNFAGANLRYADLTNVSFTRPDLSRSQLQNATLHEAEMLFADFTQADLQAADLREAVMTWANFSNAVMDRAQLQRADVREAEFAATRLKSANLTGAWAEGSKFHDADLSSARLSGARLRHAHFDRANLSDADLSDADLRRADFSSAVVKGAKLTGADLSGANLKLAQGLRDANLRGACGNKDTLLPDGTSLPDCLKLRTGKVSE